MKRFVISSVFLLLCFSVHAQILNRQVRVSLANAPFARLIDTLEKQTSGHFFYLPETTDSLAASIDTTTTVKGLLTWLFANKNIFFTEDGEGSVYITSGHTLSMSVGTTASIPPPPRPRTGAPPVQARKAAAHKPPATTRQPERPQVSITTDFEENKVFQVGPKSAGTAATITGYIRYEKTKEGINGASIAVEGSTARAISDKYGYYTITLPKGAHLLRITCMGMTDTRRQVVLAGSGTLNVFLHDYVTSLMGVTIAAEKSSNVRSTRLGVQKIDIKTIRQLPAVMGEADVLRVLQMLPGVTSASEASTGMNVRGGNVDQNLVLLDGATVYNPSHFFGFFSGFNADLVKDAELYKSSLPARYGSRLSSVLEVTTREGNRSRITGGGGIGPLSGHAIVEGPIGKNTSFIVAARSTYSDWLLGLLPDQYKNSSAGFYDANLRITSEIDARNTIALSAYRSGDRFRLNADTLYKYGNNNISARWKHVLSSKLFATLSGGFDNYRFQMGSTANKVNAFAFDYTISQPHAALDIVYTPGNKNRVEAGLSFTHYNLQPGKLRPVDSSLVIPAEVGTQRAFESAAYISDQYSVTTSLSIEAGLRYSFYGQTGPATVYEYPAGVMHDPSTIIDTSTRTGLVKTYGGLEPRIAARYSTGTNSSVKIAYSRTRQYIQLLSNTTVATPTDTWQLSNTYIQPSVADQYSVGYYHNFRNNVVETSVELYYKRILHTLAYKNGATLLLNPHIETDVANGDGKAYGLELLVKKTAGKLNGWISYTYSRAFIRMDDPLVAEPVNNGHYYPADYDKPHVANLVANYRLSHRFSVSFVTVYSTGRPITLPVTRYYLLGSYRVFYGDRNGYRTPDYFRSDLSVNIEGNHKLRKLAHSSWTLGAYNLTGRRNAYSVYFVSENGAVKGYKLSIFGTIVPFITYNFKF